MPLTTAVKRISRLIQFKNGANLIWILSPTFAIAFCYLGNDDAFFTFAANRFHIVYHIHIGQIAMKPTFNRQQTLSSNGSPTDSAPILNNMMNIYETSGTETYLGVHITNFGPTPQSKQIFCLEPYIIHTGTSKRRNITRLIISCHPLAVETGRYNKPKTLIGQRFCLQCDVDHIEN